MLELSCPNCGAPVPFQSKVSIYGVCPSCKTLTLQKNQSLENLGKAGELVPDLSPIQIGTSGKTKDGISFRVVGRIQQKYNLGIWNEWHALTSEGNSIWLAEAQGQYMITQLRPTSQKESFPEHDPIQNLDSPPDVYFISSKTAKQLVTAGDTLRIEDEPWMVKEIGLATCISGEGELPIGFETGSTSVLIDLATDEGWFATLDYSHAPPLYFKGMLYSFDQIQFTNLRDPKTFTGFQKLQEAKAIQCMGCGASLNQRNPDFSKSIACEYCGTVMDTSREELKVLSKFQEVIKDRVFLPPGTKLQLKGKECEVLGVVKKSVHVDGQIFPWTEYLLHFTGGYYWLNETNGHWTAFEPVSSIPKTVEGSYPPKKKFQKEEYKLFNSSTAGIDFAFGEFYYKIYAGDKAELADFIAPPKMLSSERTQNELFWSIGEYISAEELKKSIPVDVELPVPEGIGTAQPNPFTLIRKRNVKIAAWLSTIMLIIQIGFCWNSQDKEVFKKDLVYVRNPAPGGTIDVSFVTENFRLEGNDRKNVQIQMTSPDLSNHYIYYSLALINTQTDIAYDTGLEMSYYEGYEDGESWSEGSKSADVIIGEVPAGEYYLRLESESDYPQGSRANVSLSIKRDVDRSVYYFLFLLALWLPVPYSLFRSFSFEASRNENSDFAPSNFEDDDSNYNDD
ncbi:PF13785 domain protein [Leptospira interrogans serovar Grippotyphosa str. UI 12769]|nr:DUF4178 domain-containing protein [Leptospira interrogans]EKR45531.1 PF13785 domain protein [Leptospira interrogans serovar Grippotyphosa str. UI 08368]EMN80925.1 PF13785 domain protein [Leptospira interrogans serovar Grippotyphosa str. UI 12764]EMN84525.1 PF13785 domain protein [Leptospira interrogans serovar Grippotyphosa str. UI 12769]